MTVMTSEFEMFCKVDDLARAAGLDPNRTPREYNEFAVRCEDALKEAFKRGVAEGVSRADRFLREERSLRFER